MLGIAAHNLLDGYMPASEGAAVLWTFLHVEAFLPQGTLPVYVAYPMIPWIFVMPLGYFFGALYTAETNPQYRIRRLIQLGIALTGLFFVLRFLNVFGDPVAWAVQETPSFTVLSFFKLTKNPPSLLYLLIILGPSLLFLAFTEKWQGALASKLVVIGRVPMFFYIIHLYVIHLPALLAALMTGFSASDMFIDFWVSLEPQLQGYGFDLWFVYLVWITVVLALYPLCQW